MKNFTKAFILTLAMVLALCFGVGAYAESTTLSKVALSNKYASFSEIALKVNGNDWNANMELKDGDSLSFTIYFDFVKDEAFLYEIRDAYANKQIDTNTVFTVPFNGADYLNFTSDTGLNSAPLTESEARTAYDANGKAIFKWWLDPETDSICMKFTEDALTESNLEISSMYVTVVGELDRDKTGSAENIEFTAGDKTFTVKLAQEYKLAKTGVLVYDPTDGMHPYKVEYTITVTLLQDQNLSTDPLVITDASGNAIGHIEGIQQGRGTITGTSSNGDDVTASVEDTGSPMPGGNGSYSFTLSSADNVLKAGTYTFTYYCRLDGNVENDFNNRSEADRTNTATMEGLTASTTVSYKPWSDRVSISKYKPDGSSAIYEVNGKYYADYVLKVTLKDDVKSFRITDYVPDDYDKYLTHISGSTVTLQYSSDGGSTFGAAPSNVKFTPSVDSDDADRKLLVEAQSGVVPAGVYLFTYTMEVSADAIDKALADGRNFNIKNIISEVQIDGNKKFESNEYEEYTVPTYSTASKTGTYVTADGVTLIKWQICFEYSLMVDGKSTVTDTLSNADYYISGEYPFTITQNWQQTEIVKLTSDTASATGLTFSEDGFTYVLGSSDAENVGARYWITYYTKAPANSTAENMTNSAGVDFNGDGTTDWTTTEEKPWEPAKEGELSKAGTILDINRDTAVANIEWEVVFDLQEVPYDKLTELKLTDELGDGHELTGTPVVTVTLNDGNGTQVTLDPTDYTLDTTTDLVVSLDMAKVRAKAATCKNVKLTFTTKSTDSEVDVYEGKYTYSYTNDARVNYAYDDYTLSDVAEKTVDYSYTFQKVGSLGFDSYNASLNIYSVGDGINDFVYRITLKDPAFIKPSAPIHVKVTDVLPTITVDGNTVTVFELMPETVKVNNGGYYNDQYATISLPVTINTTSNGFNLEFYITSDWPSEEVTVLYCCRVTDEYWQNVTGDREYASYTQYGAISNGVTAEWNGATDNSAYSDYAKIVDDRIDKAAQIVYNGITYTITINPGAHDLVADSDTLTLTDKFSTGADKVTYNRASFVLKDSSGNTLSAGVDYKLEFADDGSYFNITVPDSKALTLTYTALPTTAANNGYANIAELSNTITLTGVNESNTMKDISVQVSTEGAATALAAGNRGVKINKYGENDTLLAGAIFTVYTVDANGNLTPYAIDTKSSLTVAGDPYSVKSNDIGLAMVQIKGEDTVNNVFAIKETTAPEGYKASTDVWYFYFTPYDANGNSTTVGTELQAKIDALTNAGYKVVKITGDAGEFTARNEKLAVMPTSAFLPITKTLKVTGATSVNATFDFTMTYVSATELDGTTAKTTAGCYVINDGEASVPFSHNPVNFTEYTVNAMDAFKVTFTEPGIYTFKVSESAGANTQYVTYDSTVYTVVYTVTDNNGTLSAAATVYNKEETTSENVVENGKVTFENTYETVSISGTKVWDDQDNKYGLRPDSITINLLADNVKVDSVTLTATTEGEGDAAVKTWPTTWAFTNLPKYNADGSEITYTVTEDAVSDYYRTAIKGDAETGFTITNTYNFEADGEFSIRKTVSDNTFDPNADFSSSSFDFIITPGEDNKDGYTIKAEYLVYRNGKFDIRNETLEPGDDGNYTASLTTGMSVDFTVTFTQPGEYTFTVREDFTNAPDGWDYSANEYTVTFDVTENGSEVTGITEGESTFRNTVYGPTTLTITKYWMGDNADTRMESLDLAKPEDFLKHLHLGYTADGSEDWTEYKGSITPTLDGTFKDVWSITWEGLPQCVNGKKVTWSVKEDDLSEFDYTTKYDDSDAESATRQIANTYGFAKVMVYKRWAPQDFAIDVTDCMELYVMDGETFTLVKGEDGEALKPQYAKKADHDTYTWENLPNLSKGQYVVKENKELLATMLPDCPVTVTYATLDIDDEEVDKDYALNEEVIKNKLQTGWLAVKKYGSGTNAALSGAVFTVYRDEACTIEAGTITTDDEGYGGLLLPLGTYYVRETTAPDGYKKDTTTYTVKVVDKEYPDVDVAYVTNDGNDGFSNTLETVDISGTKVWEDNNNEYSLRPDSITIKLLADGEETGKTVTLTATGEGETKTWPTTWEFTNLPKYKVDANGAVVKDADGNLVEIVYTVEEEPVTGYTTTVDGYTITNTLNKVDASFAFYKAVNYAADDALPKTFTFVVEPVGEDYAGKLAFDDKDKDYSVTEKFEISVNVNQKLEDVLTTLELTVFKAGTYQFKVYEDTTNVPDGWYYDPAVFNVTITVAANDDGSLQTPKVKYTTSPENYEISSLYFLNWQNAAAMFCGEKKWTSYNGETTDDVTFELYYRTILSYEDGIPTEWGQWTKYPDDKFTVTWDTTNETIWSFEINNLPCYIGNKSVEYGVAEVVVDGDYYVTYEKVNGTPVTADENGLLVLPYGGTITNDLTEKSVTIKKLWANGTAQDVSAYLKVYKLVDGQPAATPLDPQPALSYNKDEGTYTWSNLPKYEQDDEGNMVEILYCVKEDAGLGFVAWYSTESSAHVAEGYAPENGSIMNMKAYSTLSLTKKVEQEAGLNVTLPEEFTFVITVDNPVDLYEGSFADGKLLTTTTIAGTPVKYQYEVTIAPDATGIFDVAFHGTGDYTFTISEASDSIPDNWVYAEDQTITFTVNADGTVTENDEVTTYETRTFTNKVYGTKDFEIPKYWIGDDLATRMEELDLTEVQDFAEKLTLYYKTSGSDEWTLYEATPTVEQKNVNTWNIKWTGLPQYIGGKEVTWSVVEDDLDNYTTKYDSNSDAEWATQFIVNTYDFVSVTVFKQWEPATPDNHDLTNYLKLYIMRGDSFELVEDKPDYNEDDGSYTWTDLPRLTDGQYVVKEDAVDGYVTTYVNLQPISEDDDTVAADYAEEWGTIINTLETVDISGSKTWNDNDNAYSTRPDSITVKLMNGDTTVDSKTVTADDNWSYKFTDLPKFDVNGNEIAYTIEEVEVPGYNTTVNGYDISNTLITTSLFGDKVWQDQNDKYGLRPESITIRLYADGEPTGDTYTATAAESWNWAFSGMPKYNKDGTEIVYTVTEDAVPGYTTKVDGALITNTLETVDFSGTKVWDDEDNAGDTRPEKITVWLTADRVKTGDYVELVPDADGNWPTWSFTNLPKYKLNENGALEEIIYSAKEDPVPDGYFSEMRYNGSYFLLNTLIKGVQSELPFTKTLVNNSADVLPENMTFTFTVECTYAENADGYQIVGDADKDGKAETTVTFAKGSIASRAEATEDAAFNLTFSEAGEYYFTITEKKVDGDNIVYSEKSYSAEYQVINNRGTLEVAACYVYDLADGAYTRVDGAEFTNTYATAELQFSGSKTFLGEAAEDAYSFVLIDADDNILETVQNDKNGLFAFTKITYGPADVDKTFTYTVKEVNEGKAGVIYDKKVYEITVTVTSKEDGTLVATASVDAAALNFANGYEAKGDTTLNGTKTMNGRDLTDGEFTFVLSDKAGNEVDRTTNTADGSFTFNLAYTDEDVPYGEIKRFTYVITEVDDGAAGVTYDDAEITVIVEVTDNCDGTLTVTITEDSEEIAFTNTYAANGEVTLGGAKTMNGRELKADDEFTFELIENDETIDTATLNDGKFTFETIEYTLDDVGEHVYTVKEVEGNIAGVTYDKTEYVVTVNVADNGDGTLKVDVSENAKTISFQNIYEAKGSIALAGTKTLTGRDLAEGEFTFELIGPDNKVIEQVTNTADGSFTFAALNYTEADAGKTYAYTVKEVAGNLEGVTYATNVVTVNVTITDKGDGTLDVTADKTAEQIAFTNTYAADGSIVLSGTKTLTGRALKAGEFSFELIDEDGNVIETVKNDASGAITFSAITYDIDDAGKTFIYTVKEVEGALEGVTYATNVVTVKVAVTDIGGGKLTAALTADSEAIAFTNTYEAKGSIALAGTKTLTGRELAEGEFTFELVGPDNKVIEQVTNTADGSFTFAALNYTEADAGKTYAYTVKEVAGDLEGVTYATNVVTVNVTITDNGDGTLAVTADKTAEQIAFTNTYAADGSIVLSGTKTLTGRALKAGEFSFELIGADNKVIETVKNDASGAITFSAITYDIDDAGKTFTYTVKEVAGALEGVTYATNVVTVKVAVTDAGDGKLTAALTADSEAIAFTNTYEAKGSIALAGTKTLTGRDLAEGEFTFELVGPDNQVIEQVTNAADGSFTFAALNYTEADAGKTYAYTVKEVAGNLEGVTYATNVVTVNVTITDKGDGTLDVTADKTAEQIAFTNTYAADGEIELGGWKVLLGREFQAGDEFTFELIDESGAVIDTVTINPSSGTTADFAFAPITYDLDDIGDHTYTYKVKEKTGDLEGMTYDTTVHTVTVKVTDTGDGKLTVTASDNATALKFTNTYAADGSVQFSGSKALIGKTLNANDFSFELIDEDGNVIETVQNAADGSIVFSAIKYDLADAGKTFTYTVQEVNDGAAGITYDATVYTVTVKVADTGAGKLTVTASDNATALKFTNTYAADGSVQFSGAKTLIGKALNANDFSFELIDEDGNVIETVKNAADGSIAFSAIKYDLADAGKTYTYTVKEVNDGKAGVTYDATVYTVTVKVADTGDGKLTVTASDNATALKFTNTYAADGSVQFSGTKTLIGKALNANDFSFELIDEDGNVIETVKNAADGSIAFSAIKYDLADAGKTFTYTVKEVNDGAAGITYDATVYTVTVKVADNGDGKLTVTASDNATALKFTNTYAADGSVQFSGTKTLIGKTLNANDFSFELIDEDGNVIETVKNAADGSIAFSAIKYDLADAGKTFTYTVKEVNDGKAGVTYDTTVYTVTVKVADNGDGKLIVTASDNATALKFTNTYAADGSVQFSGSKTLIGKALNANDFSFELIDEDGNVIETVQNAADGSIVFSAIKYDLADAGKTYTYTVKEVNDGKAGVTYDATVYTVTVKVTDNGDGKLNVTASDNATALKFTNTYQATASLLLNAVKTVDGAEPTEDQVFDFVLKGEDVEMQAQNDKGSIVFGTLYFDLEDAGKTYTYTIQETTASTDRMITDDSVYVVTVTICDNGDGTLKVQPVITKDGAQVVGVVFNNQQIGSLTISKKVEGVETDEAFNMIVSLYDADGEELTGEYDYTGDVTGKITSGGVIALADGQTVTIKGLPEGAKYIVEEDVSGVYTTTVNGVASVKAEGAIQGDEARVDFVNTMETTTFSVTKVWEGTDLGAIVLTLYANGEELVPQPEVVRAGSLYTYYNLPKFDEDGNEIVYTAKERGVEGYIRIYKNVAPYEDVTSRLHDGGTVINRPEKKVSFKIQKVWSGLADGETAPDITLTLYCNGEKMDVATPTPDSDGWYKYYDLPTTVNGQNAVYTVVEEAMDGFVTYYEDANGQTVEEGVNGGKITNAKIPQTGDHASLALWTTLLVGASAALLAMLLRRRKAR